MQRLLDLLAFIVVVLLGIAVIRWTTPYARSEVVFVHDGYSKWMKPDKPTVSCCNDYDCRPTKARYDEVKKRYYALVDGVWVEIPPEKILDAKLKDNENPDGSYHVCYSQDGRREIFCFREAEPKI